LEEAIDLSGDRQILDLDTKIHVGTSYEIVIMTANNVRASNLVIYESCYEDIYSRVRSVTNQ
jgi:hypothetical protein